jgi:excinuclease ABC subunit C
MEFPFETIAYDRTTFLETVLPTIPRGSAVYKIFDTREKVIVLDKTSELRQRLERFYGERSEPVRDLDLRQITSRIEFVATASPFETTWLLYRERRQLFPKTYRKMRSFHLFTLMKINLRQRFPRIYAAKQIKAGAEYFGPFVSREQFNRMKTAVERAFKLRPCLYNIRGGDPHPDCMYFQMRTCSRPCNDDIDRAGYLADVQRALSFIQGADDPNERRLANEIEKLAVEMRFEEAETVRRKLEKLKRIRQERKETFPSIWSFNYLAVLPAHTTSRGRIGFVRQGHIAGVEEYEKTTLGETLQPDLRRYYDEPMPSVNRAWQYDEFCLVANYLLNPLESVGLIPVGPDTEGLPAEVERYLEARKAKKTKGPRSLIAQ